MLKTIITRDHRAIMAQRAWPVAIIPCTRALLIPLASQLFLACYLLSGATCASRHESLRTGAVHTKWGAWAAVAAAAAPCFNGCERLQKRVHVCM